MTVTRFKFELDFSILNDEKDRGTIGSLVVDPNGMGFVGYLIAEQVDPTRRIYFYNKLSGESQWDHPLLPLFKEVR